METFTRRWQWSITIAVMGLLTLYSCTDVELLEDIQDSGVRLNRNAPVSISGQVIDPLTCLPVANAIITTGSTTIMTNLEGYFEESVDAAELGSVFTVEKEGHITYDFTVDFDEYDGNIRIDLPTRQDCHWAGPGEGAWYKVMTNDVTYVVDILSTELSEWTEVCVSPGGNAYGVGIDAFFAQPAISVETPGNPEIKFSYGVDIRVDPLSLLAAGRKSGCLSEGSSIAAAIASDYTSTNDILSVLFGTDNNTQINNEQIVIIASTQGTVVPGVGITHTHSDFISGIVSGTASSRSSMTKQLYVCRFLPDGTLAPPILVTPDTNFPGEPHQSVPDGNG